MLAEEQLTGLDLRPHINIDAEVPLSIFSKGVFEDIRHLEPFGMDNPAPVFLSRKVEVVEQKLVGSQNDHIKLKLKQDGIVWDTMGFRLGGYVASWAVISTWSTVWRWTTSTAKASYGSTFWIFLARIRLFDSRGPARRFISNRPHNEDDQCRRDHYEIHNLRLGQAEKEGRPSLKK